MSRIYYVGSFTFPDGDAAAARVLSVGKAIRDAGHEVVFGGWEWQGRDVDRQPDGSFAFQGFRYSSMDEFRRVQLAAPRRLLNYLVMGGKTLAWLDREGLGPGDCVIAYHGHSTFIWRLMQLCKRKGARLIIDITEWYQPSHLVGGRWGVVRWDEEIRIRLINREVGRLLVIGSYLEQFYRSQGCRVLRVPPLVDLEDEKWPKSCSCRASGPLRLAYAGSPGRKDLLGNVLRALDILGVSHGEVVLDVYGPTRDTIAELLDDDWRLLDRLGERVRCHGRIPQEEVPRRLAAADFTVLLRPQQGYAEAGFPTKLVESLSSGVPIITNPTSDIGMVVDHGRSGVLLDGPSPVALARGIREVLDCPIELWFDMRQHARARARELFDYRSYVSSLGQFLAEENGRARVPNESSSQRS